MSVCTFQQQEREKLQREIAEMKAKMEAEYEQRMRKMKAEMEAKQAGRVEEMCDPKSKLAGAIAQRNDLQNTVHDLTDEIGELRSRKVLMMFP